MAMSAPDAQDAPSPLTPSSASPTTPAGNHHHHHQLHHQHDALAAAPSSTTRHQQGPPRKRRRIVISCTECHRRKQKCDRILPCANCVARNKQDSCRYEAGAPTVRAGAQLLGDGGGEEGTALLPLPKQRKPRASKYDVVDVALALSGGGGDAEPRRAVGAVSPGAAAAAAAVVGMQSASGGVVGGIGSASAGGLESAVTNFGYSASGASTLGFLKRIDDDGEAVPGAPLASLAMSSAQGDGTAYFGTRERYKSLVRQLPARPYIEKLVDVYFKEVNWQYHGVDQYVFDRQMDEWYSLPFHVLNTEGPQAFPSDLRAFPALVFQMVATSLLMLGPGSDPTFDSLKYNSSMTFEDLATDYSESGVALLALLGKHNVSHTAVIAGWMRAGFLKYSGLVTESWHAIGAAIRDAQEAGLHLDSLDPKPKSDSLCDILENQWEIQRRRKTWCLLMVWDVHTGIVLGRPTSIDINGPYTLPVDAPTPKDPARTPVTQRTENDPPSLMTRTLYIYKVSFALREIKDLEKEGPCPKDFSKVDRLHDKMLELEAQTPAYFRRQNPDTRYDDLPECFWIPLVRSQLHPLVWFNFMALHRPYIFTRPYSRTEALKASFKMLEAQRDNFATMNPRHHKTFQLFFGTFDAVVLMATIFILFPKDNADYVSAALQHFQWAVERFETMSERNRLAAASRNVLHALHFRLKKALGVIPTSGGSASLSAGSPAPIGGSSSSSNPDLQSVRSPPTTLNSSGTRTSSIFTPPAASEAYFSGGDPPIDPSLRASDGAAPQQQQGGDWALPEGFDWASIQPVYAMADVAFNGLMGTGGGVSMPNWAGGASLLNEGLEGGVGGNAPQEWSFGGDFGSDSVWSVLNQYPAEFRG